MAQTSLDRAREGRTAVTVAQAATVCPHFHAAVELIGRRWAGAILFALLEGELYYRELGAAIPGVSDRLLSQRLRELESADIVERQVHAGPPARVSYSLSVRGGELEPAIRALCEWARRWDEEGLDPTR